MSVDLTNIDFRECPRCGGYGVLDNGAYCTECGGGPGMIGSGEIMTDRTTHRRITAAELVAASKHNNTSTPEHREGI